MTTTITADDARPHSPVLWSVSLACDSDEDLEALANRFYDRYDGIVVQRQGAFVVTQYVEHAVGLQAGRQAIQDIESIGFRVRKVDRDLVDTTEIGLRLGFTRQAVRHWADGTRSKDFPPALGSPGGKRIWAWSQIASWARDQGKSSEEVEPISLEDAAYLDYWLLMRSKTQRLRQVGGTAEAAPMVGVKGDYGSAGSEMYEQSPETWLLET